MTTNKAKKLLGAKSDYELAKILGVQRQAVGAWKGTLPQGRQWQVELMVSKRSLVQ